MRQELKTLTRASIADSIGRRVTISTREASYMVDAIIEQITIALESGENVKISGFGTFRLKDKANRIGRNPKTGDEAQISARRVVTFNPSHGLRTRVSHPARDIS